jgi:hypothetical protein
MIAVSPPASGLEVVMRARLPVVLALLSAALPARGDTPAAATAGPFFGVRAGLALPYGDVAQGGPRVEDLVERKIPLGLELGYRFNGRIWGELFFDLAPATAASDLCAPGIECSASDFRIGLAFLLRMAPRAFLDPWLGAGVGVEVLNVEGRNAAAGGVPYEWSWFGFELPFVEAGLDLAVTSRFTLGPWVSATIARFTSDSARASGSDTATGSIADRARHGWYSGGIKATLHL